ncbi:MAG: hypothetical protein EXS37_03760 [Opitutus sp.]|nr:hypothetical protein [Opitutus sp.]
MLILKLRVLLVCVLIAATPSQAQTSPPAASAKKTVEPALTWNDVTQWGVEGRAFGDMERTRWYDRFPAVAKGKMTDAVWNLSRIAARKLAVSWAVLARLKLAQDRQAAAEAAAAKAA